MLNSLILYSSILILIKENMIGHMVKDTPIKVLVSTLQGDLPYAYLNIGRVKGLAHMRLGKTHLELSFSLCIAKVFVFEGLGKIHYRLGSLLCIAKVFAIY